MLDTNVIPKFLVFSLLILSNLTLFSKTVHALTVDAFPGAVGHGAKTVGGRGGSVVYVTNLNDSGPGSLRDALQQSGSRTVLFAVAGTIELNDDISITNPYVTVAGQSAPGEGVQIRGGMLKILTHDVIVRYLRMRPGDVLSGGASDRDSISLSGNSNSIYNVIIDNSTAIWGQDIGGIAILTNSHDITIQDSILGEGLYLSKHPEGVLNQNGHSLGMNITQLSNYGYPQRITIYRNLITSSESRNPQIIGGADIDLVNNVIYNFGSRSSYGNPRSLNMINNYYIKGPDLLTPDGKLIVKDTDAWSYRTNSDISSPFVNSVFESGTLLEGISVIRGDSDKGIYSTSVIPFENYVFNYRNDVNELSAQQAYNWIVTNSGATLPSRDAIDQRLISNLENRTMVLPNGTYNRFVNGSDLIWPVLAQGSAAIDTDVDGMLDSWEQDYFDNLSQGNSSNSSSDFDNDGYTDLEEFLNQTNPTVIDGVPPIVVNPPTNSVIFPTDDAFVKSTRATKAFNLTTIDIDGSPDKVSYLKFDLAELAQSTVLSAVLKLHVSSGANAEQTIWFVNNNNWNEQNITYSQKPELFQYLGTINNTKSVNTIELDVTETIKEQIGNKVSFGINTASSRKLSIFSKEQSNAQLRPTLQITIE